MAIEEFDLAKARELDVIFLAVGGDFSKDYAHKLSEGVRFHVWYRYGDCGRSSGLGRQQLCLGVGLAAAVVVQYSQITCLTDTRKYRHMNRTAPW